MGKILVLFLNYNEYTFYDIFSLMFDMSLFSKIIKENLLEGSDSFELPNSLWLGVTNGFHTRYSNHVTNFTLVSTDFGG